MDSTKVFWPAWIDSVQRSGLHKWVTFLLESAGPLNILGAQLLYLGQPFFEAGAAQNLQAIGRMLEDKEETLAFVSYLKGNLS
jgi:hypothetical protein